MIGTTPRRRPPVVTIISALTIAEAITFLIATLIHTGIPALLGFSASQIIPAAIVEGLCWLFLSVGLYAVFTYKTWAWKSCIAAHLFAVAGVVLGIFSTSGNITDDEVNFIYHRVILVVLLVVLALLATRGARETLN